MTICLQENSGKHLYEQIYEHIKSEIQAGKLLPGERLPSTRNLAEFMQISRSTVDFAYEQLLSEGYIEAKPYRGYYVCKIDELLQMQIRDYQAPTEKKSENRKEQSRTYAFDFSPNGIDMSGFPFGAWQRITKEVLCYDNNNLFALGQPQGDEDLRETICKYLHSSRGVNCFPEQIVIGAGNDYLLMLLEKILGRHKKIAMETPSYKRAYQIFKTFAYDIVTVGMDESGMKVEELEREQVTAAYCMPSHQYPTGIVMPIGRRMELLKWANAKEGRYLIEDDYDSEFRYKGKPIPSLQASDHSGKVIYIGTFSKAIAPAIRVSYMVLPDKLLEIYKENCYFFSSTVSRIDQRILNEFISQGYFERYLNKARKIYKEKHDKMLELLKPFLEDFSLQGEHAGLHMLLTSKTGKREEELISLAKKQGVKVYGMSEAFIGEDKEKMKSFTVILGYGSLTLDQIEDGIKALQKAWLP